MRPDRQHLGRAWLLLTLGLTIGLGAETADPVLTDEAVVRMFVSGVPESEIVRQIGLSRVEFDLGPEMLEELTLAGIPETILEAMKRREAELHPVEPPAAEASAASPHATLHVLLNPVSNAGPEAKRPQVRLLDVVDPVTREALQLREDDSRFTDLAIVLACLTADHVPDHWRSESPMGRDFNAMPRHRMLLFVPGAVRSEAGPLRKLARRSMPGGDTGGEKPGVLSLEVPPVLEVELEPGVTHDLLLGLAARVEDRYLLLSRAVRPGVVLGDDTLELTAILGDGASLGPAALSVSFS